MKKNNVRVLGLGFHMGDPRSSPPPVLVPRARTVAWHAAIRRAPASAGRVMPATDGLMEGLAERLKAALCGAGMTPGDQDARIAGIFTAVCILAPFLLLSVLAFVVKTVTRAVLGGSGKKQAAADREFSDRDGSDMFVGETEKKVAEVAGQAWLNAAGLTPHEAM